MANYKLKLDLTKLCGTQIVEVQGRKCVVLPVDDNGIFLSQRGSAYLDLNIRESREVKYGQTHYALPQRCHCCPKRQQAKQPRFFRWASRNGR